MYGRKNFFLSPRKQIYEARAVLDIASGLFDPHSLPSVHAYLSALSTDLGLPPRTLLYDNRNLQFDRGVESVVRAFDTDRERDHEIGRNYTQPRVPRGHCYVNKDRRPDRVEIEGLGKELKDIAIIRFPATQMLNEMIDQYNRVRDPEN